MYIKLVGVYISDIHLQVLYTPTSFFTRGIHEIYTPAIEQSDWSECTSHGTNILVPWLVHSDQSDCSIAGV